MNYGPENMTDRAPMHMIREVSPPPDISPRQALDRVLQPIPPRSKGIALPTDIVSRLLDRRAK